jgi:hypothetical protein
LNKGLVDDRCGEEEFRKDRKKEKRKEGMGEGGKKMLKGIGREFRDLKN